MIGEMTFAGQSALISGGAGGLGGATARRLLKLGMGVVVFEPDLARAAAFASKLGDGAIGVDGDHNNDADVAAAIAATQQLGIFTVNVHVDGKPHDMQVFAT